MNAPWYSNAPWVTDTVRARARQVAAVAPYAGWLVVHGYVDGAVGGACEPPAVKEGPTAYAYGYEIGAAERVSGPAAAFQLPLWS